MKTGTTILESRRRRRPAATAVAAGTLLLAGAFARAGMTLEGRVVTTPRHVITLDETGLPAQLEIRAVTGDIPLAWRAGKKLPAARLRRLGRGPQLAAPVRIEALIDGVTSAAKADAPAALQKTDKGVEAAATWQAGALQGRLRLQYTEDGAMTGQVTFYPKGAALERLDLVLELSGPVDTAIAGDPVAAVAGEPLPQDYGSLPSEPGMLWRNGAAPAGDGGAHEGRVQHFFLGSGDRGFTWLAYDDDGFVIRGKAPSMSVERSREEVTIWRIALVNKRARGRERTAGFTLLTHPARPRAAGRRPGQWQPWPDIAALPALDAAARGTLENTLVRADAGSVHEAAAARALLAGPAGGDALSAEATLADRFPIGLFRYLSASHTALAVQLRPDAAALAPAGASPAPDRMALGRALLHDIGVDLRGLASRVRAAGSVRALEEFGVFSDDGKTEFLPYWRTAGILQYGEAFEGDIGFAVTKEDPTARTKVSAYVRPAGSRRKALFVLVNEGTNAVREHLYILDPNYLFGGPNKVQVGSIYSQLDFSGIPADSDWRRSRVEDTKPEAISRGTMGRGIQPGRNRRHMSELMDLETGGFVRLGEKEVKVAKFVGDAVKNAFLVYGPVYVPPRGMRLLYGAGEAGFPSGVAGKVVDRETGTPLSVPVHIISGTFKEAETPAPDRDRRLIAKVQTDEDGRFRRRLRGGTYTVVAEVDGRMHSFAPPERDEDGTAYWPRTRVEAGHWRGHTIVVNRE